MKGRLWCLVPAMMVAGCAIDGPGDGSSASAGPATTGGASSTGAGAGATSTGGGSSTGAGGTTTTGGLFDVGDGGLFYPAVHYAAGLGPHALTTFRDDGGQIGLATADYGDGMIWVLVGNGDGTFADGGSYGGGPSGPSLQTICSADFNGDGLADLAVDAWQNTTDDMMLLSGAGSGAFSSANSNLGGDTTYDITTADLNSDGLPDLLVIVDQSLVIGLGLGDGGFAWGAPITGIGGPRGLAVGDLGQLGAPQIAVADNDGNQVYVLAPDGGGGYTTVGPFAVDQGPIAIGVADFNGDGCLDVVTGNNVGDSISVLISSCEAGMPPVVSTYPLGTSPAQGDCLLTTCGRPQWLAIADFDGNGTPDVAVAFYDPLATGENVALFLSNADGSMQEPIYYQADLGPSDIVTGDFNGDGRPDLAVSNWDSNDVSVFIHR